MRTTIILNDDLFKKASQLAKISQKTELIHKGLQALIEKHARLRLASLGGSDKKAKVTPRRRS